MPQANKEKLAHILCDTFITSCKKLGVMLKKDIGVSFGSLDEFDSIRQADNVLKDVVIIKTTFEKGDSFFVIPADCGAPIAEIMMTGDVEPSGGEFGELKEKALGEAFSQIMQDYSKNLSKALDEPLNFEVVEAKYCKTFNDAQKIIMDIASVVALNFDFELGDISKGILQQIVLGDIFKTMTNDLPGESTSGSDLNIDENFLNIDEKGLESEIDNSSITVQPVKLPSFDGQTSMQVEGNRNFELLLDIKLGLTVELGRSELAVKKVLELTRGSIIELDKVAGEPVELYANGKLIAKGEVVVIEDNFGLRITNIVSPSDRIKNL